jgi:hypothetical protein
MLYRILQQSQVLGICIAVVMLTWPDLVTEVSLLEAGTRPSFRNILFSDF